MSTIYCDEAGYTGNNLLQPDQPLFVYSAVRVEPGHARDLVDTAIARYRLQGDELKSKNLLKSTAGMDAVLWILSEVAESAKILAWEKRYALASHFFENVFEPVIASQSTIFYNIGFHKFVSTIIYIELIANSESFEAAFDAFHTLMRKKDISHMTSVTAPLVESTSLSPPMKEILTFATIHEKALKEELAGLQGIGALERWVLDLTFSSLWQLLAQWGEEVGELEVYCDASKPISDYRDVFDRMIHRGKTAHVELGGLMRPVTFSMRKPIELGDSTAFPGLQIADVVAGAVAYALRDPQLPGGKEIRTEFDRMDLNLVAPSAQTVDLLQRDAFINAGVLNALVGRSLKGEDLFEFMPEYIYRLGNLYDRKLSSGELSRLIAGA